MADTFTTNLNLTKPEVGASTDTWGTKINADLDALDAIFAVAGTAVNVKFASANFDDNAKAIFGTGDDLEIYHDGSNSYIKDGGTGDLRIASNDLYIKNGADTETKAYFLDNGAVGLYFDDAVKFATTSSGATVTGTLVATLATAAQPNITSVGTLTSFRSTGIDDNADALAITIDSSENVGIGETTVNSKLEIKQGSGNWYEGIRINRSSNTTQFGTFSNNSGATFIGAVDTTGGDNNVIVLGNSTNGTTFAEKMRITSAGLVGIGTASPSGTLDVQAANAGQGIRLTATTGTNGAQYKATTGAGNLYMGIDTSSGGSFGKANSAVFWYDAAQPMVFATNNSEKMRIDSSGNVGIGDASPANFSGYVVASLADSTGAILDFKTTGSEGVFARIQGAVNNGLFITNEQAHPIAFNTNATERMRIDGSGNVGIGCTPSAKLNTNLAIEGAILAYMSGTSLTFDGDENIAVAHSSSALGTGTAAGLLLVNNNSSNSAPSPLIAFSAKSALGNHNHTYATIHGEKSSSGADNNWNTGALIFSTGSGTGPNERMRIDSSGHVMFGTTTVTPATTNVTGVSALNDGRFHVSAQSQTALFVNRKSTDGTAVEFRNDATIVGSISVASASTAYNTSSDARLKDIIGEARGLKVINELNPVSYNWKADGKSDEGLIAQEVKELVPNAVSQTDEGYYQMDYSKLVTPLIKAIQEQQTQIDALQSEINLLKGE